MLVYVRELLPDVLGWYIATSTGRFRESNLAETSTIVSVLSWLLFRCYRLM